jgi:hypothetical protein
MAQKRGALFPTAHAASPGRAGRKARKKEREEEDDGRSVAESPARGRAAVARAESHAEDELAPSESSASHQQLRRGE